MMKFTKPTVKGSSDHVEQKGMHTITDVPGNDSLCLFNAVFIALRGEGIDPGCSSPAALRSMIIKILRANSGEGWGYAEEASRLSQSQNAGEASVRVLAETFGVRISVLYLDVDGRVLRKARTYNNNDDNAEKEISLVLQMVDKRATDGHYVLRGDFGGDSTLQAVWDWANHGIHIPPISSVNENQEESDEAVAALFGSIWHDEDTRSPSKDTRSPSDMSDGGQGQNARAIRAALESNKQALEDQIASLELILKDRSPLSEEQVNGYEVQLATALSELEGLGTGNQRASAAPGVSHDDTLSDAMIAAILGGAHHF